MAPIIDVDNLRFEQKGEYGERARGGDEETGGGENEEHYTQHNRLDPEQKRYVFA
jgi:hypothetical protein